MSSITMSDNVLVHEDLENVPLVRMEDVQPSRDRLKEALSLPISIANEVYKICVVDNIEFENECFIDHEDNSNIGSMVSIQSEDVIENDASEEIIVPQALQLPLKLAIEPKEIVDILPTKIIRQPDQWPTLEILPGGVIKNGDKINQFLDKKHDTEDSGAEEMMYACAKCSQGFKYLFSLVKHVKWHEDQKKSSDPRLERLKPFVKNKYNYLQSGKKNNPSKINKRKPLKRLKT